MTPEQVESERRCLHHISHDQRIEWLEDEHEKTCTRIQRVEENMSRSPIWVAGVQLVGILFTATAAFLGVVLAPIIAPLMHSIGLL